MWTFLSLLSCYHTLNIQSPKSNVCFSCGERDMIVSWCRASIQRNTKAWREGSRGMSSGASTVQAAMWTRTAHTKHVSNANMLELNIVSSLNFSGVQTVHSFWSLYLTTLYTHCMFVILYTLADTLLHVSAIILCLLQGVCFDVVNSNAFKVHGRRWWKVTNM